MNKHIELVEKWLADKNSVSLEELEASRDAANAAYAAAWASWASCDAASDAAAAYYVKRYKELTKEDA